MHFDYPFDQFLEKLDVEEFLDTTLIRSLSFGRFRVAFDCFLSFDSFGHFFVLPLKILISTMYLITCLLFLFCFLYDPGNDREGMLSYSDKSTAHKKKNYSSTLKIFGVDLSPDNVAVAMVYFVQGVLGLARLAVSFYLKDDLHLDPAEVYTVL